MHDSFGPHSFGPHTGLIHFVPSVKEPLNAGLTGKELTLTWRVANMPLCHARMGTRSVSTGALHLHTVALQVEEAALHGTAWVGLGSEV